MFVTIVTSLLVAQLGDFKAPWLNAALRDADEIPKAGVLTWTARAKGFDTAELDVLVDGQVVDTVHLIRLDPARYNFQLMHDVEGPHIEKWREDTGALAVINSSFYIEETNQPETPVRIQGHRDGPRNYVSKHGAFVMGEKGADVIDLKGRSVDEAISKYPNAVVSYPLLFDRSGTIRAQGNPTWLANRTFVGIDTDKRVVMGTTETGYFALRRLARFLNAAKALKLEIALNLDGGPPACQSISVGDYKKTVWGRYEANDSSGRFVMFWGKEPIQWGLPLVIGVFSR